MKNMSPGVIVVDDLDTVSAITISLARRLPLSQRAVSTKLLLVCGIGEEQQISIHLTSY
jgi:hypothetical protein